MEGPTISVALIGYQDQGNLGLGYLAAVLAQRGHRVHVIDFRQGEQGILEELGRNKPDVVGFSLIFQYFLPRFARLAKYLRSRGIDSHFTAGGHFASLRYTELIGEIPELNSVVLFEGEHTLLELAERLSAGVDWRQVQGIAYRDGSRVMLNPLRPLIADLDQLPRPWRGFDGNAILGRRVYPLIATRGCPRKCSFCSIREFYSKAPGKLVRRRSPRNVVEEMRALYEDEGARIFLFQDDDFPLLGPAGRRWVREFIDQLGRHGLTGKVIWKISCRVDEVDEALFSEMRRAGLYLVYLGIESGTDVGLEVLNKEVTAKDNRSAVDALKRGGLMFGYGFMLFDPSSTFDTVAENIAFLRSIIGDGAAPVVFCKMLPYAGTPIEKTLKDSGRLTGTVARPDYEFLDTGLDDYYRELNAALDGWTHGEDSLSSTLNLALHELSVIKRLFPSLAGTVEYETYLREITKRSNEFVFQLVEESASAYRRDRRFDYSVRDLGKQARGMTRHLVAQRDRYIAQNQERILGDRNL